MGKKRSKVVVRPWCWYCEREFEDEKVLMQHQKAKHFKCKMCPRRLNTAGGLAVHIQQVHKLEPENLPRIENALPGRDGYEVEIFGMEGIPAPDVADYKRRKEIELGLNPGTITQPQAKRPKIENRVYTQEELRVQLEAHKALMGAVDNPAPAPETSTGPVVNAAPQTYVAPPMHVTPPTSVLPVISPPFPPGGPSSGSLPGQPPFPPFPSAPGFPGPPPPGFPLPPGFPQPPPGALPPGVPPFLPGVPPPPGLAMPPPPGISSLPMGPSLPGFSPPPSAGSGGKPSAGQAVPAGLVPPVVPFAAPAGAPPVVPQAALHVLPGPLRAPSDTAQKETKPVVPIKPPIPNPALKQENPELKKGQVLKYTDANYSPEENRAYDIKYFYCTEQRQSEKEKSQEESRGRKRARAEDFL